MELGIQIPPEVIGFLEVTFLVFLRVVWLVALTPVFGGERAPKRFKTAVALILAAVLAGSAYRPTAVPSDSGEFVVFATKEALIGLMLAVFVRILFDMLAEVGSFIDQTRGFSQAVSASPFEPGQQLPLNVFHMSLMLALFFSIGGHRMVIDALGASFEAAPIGRDLPERFLGGEGMRALVGLVADLFVISLKLAAPVIVAVFFVDVMLGLTNRVAQQVQVFFLGMTVKGIIALAFLVLTIGYTLDVVLDESFGRIATFFGR